LAERLRQHQKAGETPESSADDAAPAPDQPLAFTDPADATAPTAAPRPEAQAA